MVRQLASSERETIIVTGGAGYIGSHTCKALHAAGYVPVALDDLSNGHAWAAQWGPLEVGDIGDDAFLNRSIERHRPVAAIHFAAHAYVGESVVDPRKYYRNNVAGSLALFEALLDHGVDKIVFSSTCSTYGVPEVLPIRETHPLAPINPYGASKAMIERILEDFDLAYGQRYVTLRYFNAAGADPDGEVGEAHDPETHLIPLIIETALGRRSHVDIMGTDYPTPDGTAVRDYVHVTDLAQAHVLALEYLRDGRESTILNLGTGTGHSVDEIVREVERASGKPVSVRRVERRPGDPPALVADATLAREILGWIPQLSSVDAIVASALRWHARA